MRRNLRRIGYGRRKEVDRLSVESIEYENETAQHEGPNLKSAYRTLIDDFADVECAGIDAFRSRHRSPEILRELRTRVYTAYAKNQKEVAGRLPAVASNWGSFV